VLKAVVKVLKMAVMKVAWRAAWSVEMLVGSSVAM
jgi:hypothetical protein